VLQVTGQRIVLVSDLTPLRGETSFRFSRVRFLIETTECPGIWRLVPQERVWWWWRTLEVGPRLFGSLTEASEMLRHLLMGNGKQIR